MTTGMRAAVIGSGFGGLALAARLQARGIATTVFEGRDKPGGSAYVHEDKGYVFDGGPTVITDPTAIEEVFAEAGRKLSDYVELMPVSPFYRLTWPDGSSFDYVNDQDALERQIAAFNPADVEGYRAFLRYSKDLFAEGYVKLGSVPFLSFQSMIRVAPTLVRLEAFRSVHAMVARFIKDERLRQAFSFHALLVGGNPFQASSVYALIHALEREWGVHFARGGTGALVKGMVQLIEDLGGEVRVNAPVERILTEGDRATGIVAVGRSESFDIVATNANVMHSYRDLLGHHKRGREEARRLADKRYSMSLFVIYFGARKTWPGLQHHTILFGPRYRELIREIFGGRELPEDFSLYLHAPTVTDPSLAPPGCTAFYVLSPVPHLGHAPIDWASRVRATATGSSLRWRSATSRPQGKHRDLPHLHAAGFQGPDEQPSGLRLLARACPAAIGLVPAAQQGRRDPQPLSGRCRDTPWRRASWRDRLGQGDGLADPRGGRPRTAGGMKARDRIDRQSELALRRGSRSFNAAAMLLEPATRDSARLLYAWCRHVDDIIDGQDLGRPGAPDVRSPKERLAELRAATLSAWHGEPQIDPAFEALRRVTARHAIPVAEPLTLIEGFAMDVEGRRYATIEDTLHYCYHVAGVVGLMMARVLGVRDERLFDHACDLGLAFQLTNIARDVVEDYRNGRIYLPEDWLREEGLTPATMALPAHRAALHRVVARLIATAEPYYESAARGIDALPPRAAWAIGTAARVYRAIGDQVLAAGAAAWDERRVVPARRKSRLALSAGVGALWRRRPVPAARPAGLWSRPG